MFRSLSQPMEEFWIRLLALLVLVHQAGSASDTTELIGVAGRAITFHSPDTGGNAALWSFGDEPIVTVEFGDPPRFKFSKEEFKTRFTVSERGRALSISRLRLEDTGIYSVDTGGKVSTFTLFVYKELTEPTVTCEVQDCLDSICLVSMSCSVPGDGFGNISYSWTGWGLLWEKRSAVLGMVDKSSLDKPDPLTCTARNAVSSRSVTVTTPGELCPGTSSSNGVGVTVGVTVGVLVVILFGFLVFCKHRGYRSLGQVSKAPQLGFLSWLGRATRAVSTPRDGWDHHLDWPHTSSDHHQDWPQTSSDHHWDRPQTSFAHRDRPWTTYEHPQDWPQTSSDHHQDRPQASSDHHQDQPQASSDHHQDQPQASSDHHQDRPQTSFVHHWHHLQTSSDQGRPHSWSSSDHHWDRPQTNSARRDRPWTTYEHPQDWPQTSSDHHQDWPWTSVTHSVPSGTTWQEPDTTTSPMKTLVDMSPSALQNSVNNQFLKLENKQTSEHQFSPQPGKGKGGDM